MIFFLFCSPFPTKYCKMLYSFHPSSILNVFHQINPISEIKATVGSHITKAYDDTFKIQLSTYTFCLN